jgi:beta-fructofuranosidase
LRDSKERDVLFFKPRGAWCADVIPYFHDGTYHLFYLRSHRDREGFGEGTPWGHVTTTDFVHFEALPDALLPGTRDEQDLWPFTGSVIERHGTFHIFYTGHNPHFDGTGRPVQGIMHATSPDLVHWMKDDGFPLFVADTGRYEPDDWRDPFVFWNQEAGEYWMLIAARHNSGPRHRRGLMGLASSIDLYTWTIREPFWDPGAFHTHECPDLFEANGRWYLWFSTTTLDDRVATQYRSAPSLAGPWRVEGDGSLDGFAWYAAKTASDGKRRFAFGWLPSHARDDLAVAPLAIWARTMDPSDGSGADRWWFMRC